MNTTTGHHYYSTASDPPSGFVTDGILGYLRMSADSAAVGLYRHFGAATGDYVLTTSSTPPTGYALQATLGYLYTTPSYDSGDHQDLAYHYDEVGNITAVADNIFTASRLFTYDALNRLETAYGYFGQNQALKDCTYNYNSIGNIMNKCGVTFTYGDTMHPSAVTSISSGKTYSYDPNGNMQNGGGRDFVWDIDNRVTSVTLGGSVTSMEYDYTGARVKKDGAGGQTLYPFQGYEVDPSGTVTKFIRIGGENFASKKGTNTYLFYHNDHLGGVNVITDGSGARCQLNEYDPWGGVSRSEGATPGSEPTCDPDTRFTGQKLDPETGLYYYGGRYYDPEISRFISPDPFVQDPGDPQNLNRYSYVLNDPINYTDPSGYFYMGKGIADGPFGTSGIFERILGGIIGFLTGGPMGALMGAGVIDFGMSSTTLHVFQIFQGIFSLFTGNPGGMFQISAGAVGLSGSPGSEYVSGLLSAMGGGAGAIAGGGGVTPGSSSSGGGGGLSGTDLSSLGGLGGLTLVNAVGGGGNQLQSPQQKQKPPQPGDPGMDGPHDVYVTRYGWTGKRTSTGPWPNEMSATFFDPTTLAVSGVWRNGNVYKPYSIRPGTKVYIEGYGWAKVQDACGACTVGHPDFKLPLGATEGRIDLYSNNPDSRSLGVRQIWIYHGP